MQYHSASQYEYHRRKFHQRTTVVNGRKFGRYGKVFVCPNEDCSKRFTSPCAFRKHYMKDCVQMIRSKEYVVSEKDSSNEFDNAGPVNEDKEVISNRNETIMNHNDLSKISSPSTLKENMLLYSIELNMIICERCESAIVGSALTHMTKFHEKPKNRIDLILVCGELMRHGRRTYDEYDMVPAEALPVRSGFKCDKCHFCCTNEKYMKSHVNKCDQYGN